MYHISAKANNPRLSYDYLHAENLGAVRHLEFKRKLIFTIQQPQGPMMFVARFSVATLYCLFLEVGGSHLHQIWGTGRGLRQSLPLSVHLPGFIYIVVFRNQSPLK